MKKLSFLLILVFAMPTVANAEEYLYVMSKRAKILSSPAFGSKTVKNMIKGEKIISLEKKTNWYRVKHEDKTGWISRLSVASHPPLKRTRRIAKMDEKLQNNSRRRASTVSTTAAVRGLSSIDRSRVNSSEVRNFAALEKMESLDIPQDEIFVFMDQLSQ